MYTTEKIYSDDFFSHNISLICRYVSHLRLCLLSASSLLSMVRSLASISAAFSDLLKVFRATARKSGSSSLYFLDLTPLSLIFWGRLSSTRLQSFLLPPSAPELQQAASPPTASSRALCWREGAEGLQRVWGGGSGWMEVIPHLVREVTVQEGEAEGGVSLGGGERGDLALGHHGLQGLKVAL